MLVLLVGISILGCAFRFAYRFAFEGADRIRQPPQYRSIRYNLDIWAASGAIAAIPLLWWLFYWWLALLWVVAYMTVEFVITQHGERRFIGQITPVLRQVYPMATAEELNLKALERLEFEKSANEAEHDYL